MAEFTLPLSDITLRATVAGVGPTILLLHAGGENRAVWKPVSDRLAADGLRTVTYDLRGHGESPGRAVDLRTLAADVTEMIRREDGLVVVVGASLGGFSAVAALADSSVAQRVAGLVLVDVVPDPDPDPTRAWLKAHGMLDDHVELTEDILASGTRLRTITSMLQIPVLLVRADRSPLGDADAERLRATNRRVAVTRVPGAGHLIARDAPADLARIVSDHAATWLAANIIVHRAFDLQRTLGAEQIDHPGGTLYTHLRRVHSLLSDWNASPRARLAAICHASYGTDGFPRALLPVAERKTLLDVVGPGAENLVYLYCSCDRTRTYPRLGDNPLLLTDRFTGSVEVVDGSDLHDFAVLTIANELDVMRYVALSGPARRAIRDTISSFTAYAPAEAAEALADDALHLPHL